MNDYAKTQDSYFQEKVAFIEGIPYNQRYPYSFSGTDSVAELRGRYESQIAPGTNTDVRARIAGRIMGRREMGKTNFYDLQENTAKIQLMLTNSNLTDNSRSLITAGRGDIYGVGGTLMKTKTGELSVKVADAVLLAKCLRQMPDKIEGLQDSEAKYRLRHLELLTNPDMINVFRARTATFDSIRRQLNEMNFLEVDTPVLQPVYGGANARPFITSHNALDQEMYLRISNELYLKRLIVGGIDRVFEFARDFRNEGIDATHNPEFTQLEVYQAYADYSDMMKLAESLVSRASMEVRGTTDVDFGGHKINLAPPWQRMTMEDAVERFGGIKWRDCTDDQLKDLLHDRKVKYKGKAFSRGRALNSLFEHFGEENLIQPTMIYDYPVDVSPLAKKHRSKEGFVERFELFIGGKEFGNAYSELNDPLDQRARFEEQQRESKLGDDEAHPLDEAFLRTMEFGMPPTGGIGIGMDRLVALLTGQKSIKDVLLFPTLRNK